MAKQKKQKTISRTELCSLVRCNSDKLPSPVSLEGRRMRWVGIGWVDEGPATGQEPRVVD
jgi:hypothetical protein